jgi:hypothetical protein
MIGFEITRLNFTPGDSPQIPRTGRHDDQMVTQPVCDFPRNVLIIALFKSPLKLLPPSLPEYCQGNADKQDPNGAMMIIRLAKGWLHEEIPIALSHE